MIFDKDETGIEFPSLEHHKPQSTTHAYYALTVDSHTMPCLLIFTHYTLSCT